MGGGIYDLYTFSISNNVKRCTFAPRKQKTFVREACSQTAYHV